MKYVYILENDPKAIQEILEALEKIDPKLKPRIFYSLRQFANWIQKLTKIGKKAIAQGGAAPGGHPDIQFTGVTEGEGDDDDELLCLISSDDIFGSSNLPLMKKTQALFIQKGLCKK